MIHGDLGRAVCALVTLLTAAGCGKKGPPLPPFVRIPAAVDTIAAARAGSRVYVTLTVPAANIDASVPVDIARIEVYGFTGTTPPPAARWVESGALVATIPVEPPPLDSDPAAAASPRPDPGTGAAQPGTSVTVAETLEPDDLIVRTPPAGPAAPAEVTPARSPGAPRRFYIAIPFSQRGRPGPPGAQAELALAVPPDPPTDLRATYDATSVSLVWEPSGGLVGFLLDRQAGVEPPPFDELPAPSGETAPGAGSTSAPTTYRVYRAAPPGTVTVPAGEQADTWRAAPPEPMSDEPLAQVSASDAVTFGEARCYAVRAERGGVLSDASAPACLTPIDRFPPSTPTGLASVPSEGAINLIWEPSSDGDLAGYLVLRRGPGDATLRQLTDRPIAEARYRDASVEPGMPYTYAVVAVDRQSPMPNVSAPSATVDDVAP
jgi:hypothetical protein